MWLFILYAVMFYVLCWPELKSAVADRWDKMKFKRDMRKWLERV